MTGVFVPAGTPKPIVDLLQKEISTMVTAPEIKARLLELGVVPGGGEFGPVRGLRQGRSGKMEKGHHRGKSPADRRVK